MVWLLILVVGALHRYISTIILGALHRTIWSVSITFFYVTLFQDETIILKPKSATLEMSVALLFNTFYFEIMLCLFLFTAFVKQSCNFSSDIISFGCP